MRLFWRGLAKLIIFLKRAYHWFWKRCQLSLFADCGNKVEIRPNCEFTYDHIHIGNNVYIGTHCSFIAAIAHIWIGNHVMFGPNVTIRGGNHRIDVVGEYMINVKEKLPMNDQDVIIEDDVWIGSNVTILKGVRIGRGSVIGAGSVVSKDVLPYTIRVGNQGILEKPRFTDEQLMNHEELMREKYDNDDSFSNRESDF